MSGFLSIHFTFTELKSNNLFYWHLHNIGVHCIEVPLYCMICCNLDPRLVVTRETKESEPGIEVGFVDGSQWKPLTNENKACSSYSKDSRHPLTYNVI